ncbi:hypothetical protein TRAPUB_5381 [Trametes pubescens]|uniref:MFS general substrate transporter n=1 Tax=Trametes pubescens TaxID=154538 RepID=A0A1M2V8I2_TRAPU|nr:hypothetical protein TRAPUB_5381 [Trametes pubescens]
MEPHISLEKRGSVADDSPAHNKPHLGTRDVDVAAELAAGNDFVLDPEEAARVRCFYQAQFNWLGTAFYLSFLAFEWPQNLALQYLPVGKWMSVNILVWAIALLCHAAAKTFGQFFVCRLFLGICEGAITPGSMIITSMFYTRQEQTQRVGYWLVLMNGAAIILLGLVAYGALHIHATVLQAWQWLMIIAGVITFFFPDSSATAWFLTPEERVIAIERIKVNQAGIENKHFKKDQFIECLQDPKTWLFFFFSMISNVTNSLSNQRQIIVAGFGFTALQTTLLGCVDGVVESNGRAYSGALAYCVAILGSILVNTLPLSTRVGLLFSYWISITSIAPFVVMLAWVGSTTAGHTKRLTTNTIVMIGYAVGPQHWEKRYQPRNHVPWLILSICWAVSALLLLTARAYLSWENARRERAGPDERYDDMYITKEHSDGTVMDKKVEKVFLDLTDMQNRDFRYEL